MPWKHPSPIRQRIRIKTNSLQPNRNTKRQATNWTRSTGNTSRYLKRSSSWKKSFESSFMNYRRSFAFLLLLLPFSGALAQPGPRPKIGVVLSGGGAKGLAHIGILKAIDSAGLKVDF